MFCKFCGPEIPDDSIFCKKYGKSLKEETVETKDIDKKTLPEKKPGRKLPVILGIAIPLGIIIIALVLVFTGIIPLLNRNGPVAGAAEDVGGKEDTGEPA